MHKNIIGNLVEHLDNKKLIDIMNEGVYDPGIFKAIFLFHKRTPTQINIKKKN